MWRHRPRGHETTADWFCADRILKEGRSNVNRSPRRRGGGRESVSTLAHGGLPLIARPAASKFPKSRQYENRRKRKNGKSLKKFSVVRFFSYSKRCSWFREKSNLLFSIHSFKNQLDAGRGLRQTQRPSNRLTSLRKAEKNLEPRPQLCNIAVVEKCEFCFVWLFSDPESSLSMICSWQSCPSIGLDIRPLLSQRSIGWLLKSLYWDSSVAIKNFKAAKLNFAPPCCGPLLKSLPWWDNGNFESFCPKAKKSQLNRGTKQTFDGSSGVFWGNKLFCCLLTWNKHGEGHVNFFTRPLSIFLRLGSPFII